MCQSKKGKYHSWIGAFLSFEKRHSPELKAGINANVKVAIITKEKGHLLKVKGTLIKDEKEQLSELQKGKGQL